MSIEELSRPHASSCSCTAAPAVWTAYVLTRPLGASLGDFLSQPVADGGLGLGTTVTSAIFLTVIAGVVVYLSSTHKDAEMVAVE